MATPGYEPGIASHDHGAVCRGRGVFVSSSKKAGYHDGYEDEYEKSFSYVVAPLSGMKNSSGELHISMKGGGYVAAYELVRLISNRIS